MLALMIDPHNEKARFRLAKALEGEGKIADAFLQVASVYQKNKKVYGDTRFVFYFIGFFHLLVF